MCPSISIYLSFIYHLLAIYRYSTYLIYLSLNLSSVIYLPK